MAKPFLIPIALVAGAVGAPSLYLGADTTTGLYRPSANQVAIAVSGTQCFLAHSTGATVTGNLDLYSASDYGPQFIARHNGSTVGSAGYFIARRSRAGSTAVVSGDTLGTIIFQGHDGATWVNGPYISSIVDGTVSTGVVPAALTFVTGGTERARFDSAGKFLVGMTASKFYGGAFQVGTQASIVAPNASATSFLYVCSDDALNVTSPTYRLASVQYHGVSEAGNLTYCPTVAKSLAAEFGVVNSNAMVFTTNNAAPMVFATNAVERFRIGPTGSVTVGVKGTAGSLRLEAMDGVNEGGEMWWGGAAANTDVGIDNYAGGMRFFGAGTVVGGWSATGDFYIGASTGFNGTRYLDVNNVNNGASAAADIRLITRNAADTANIAVDLIKYKTGAFHITNTEPSATGVINLGAYSATQAQIVAVSGANQYVTLAGDVSNGPRISAGGAANANLYLSAGAGLGSLYLYTNNVGTCGMRVDHVAGASRFVVVAPHATTPSIGVSAGYLNLTSDTRCSARMSVGNVAPDPVVALYTLISASTTGSEFGSYTQIAVTSASGSPTKYGAYHQLVSSTGFANTGLMIAAIANVTHQVTGTMTTAYANYSGSAVTAAGTITTLANYYSADVTLSGGGTVGTLYGYNSAIAAGSGRWNFYASGTAPSYFGGPVKIAGTAKTDGYFDAGTTAPTNATRLNYDGYLYATRFYGDGSQLTSVTATDKSKQDFRLTLTTGVPVTTSDVTLATTIYCTPYKGNQIGLYTGGAWVTRSSAQFSLALGTLTSAKPYDVFCYDNAGTPTLEFLAWTDDTTRATALAYQDGILVKSGDATRRYLGTFYTTSTTQTEDSVANRYLWNYYNRVARTMSAVDITDSWAYTTATWREARATTTNRLNFVIGYAEDAVVVDAMNVASNSTVGPTLHCGIGLDSTSALVEGSLVAYVPSAVANQAYTMKAEYKGVPAAGKHYAARLERSSAAGTTTWYGDGDGTVFRSGIHGSMLG